MKSKNKNFIRFLFLLSTLPFIAVSHAQNPSIVASGKYIEKNITLSPFDKIQISGSCDVEYVQTANRQPRAQILGSNNLVGLVTCTVSNHTLTVQFKKRANINFGKNGRLTVKVYSPSLKSVDLKGSGDINLNQFRGDALNIRTQSSGDLFANEVICGGSLSVTSLASGEIKIKKSIRAKTATFNLSGSGDLTASGIFADVATATLSGSGDLAITGKSKIPNIILKLSGSGDSEFSNITAGNITAVVSGSGDLNLSGATRSATLTAAGSGDIDATDLSAENVSAKVSGSGNIRCHASKTLQSNIRGSGDVSYRGNASVQSASKKKPERL